MRPSDSCHGAVAPDWGRRLLATWCAHPCRDRPVQHLGAGRGHCRLLRGSV